MILAYLIAYLPLGLLAAAVLLLGLRLRHEYIENTRATSFIRLGSPDDPRARPNGGEGPGAQIFDFAPTQTPHRHPASVGLLPTAREGAGVDRTHGRGRPAPTSRDERQAVTVLYPPRRDVQATPALPPVAGRYPRDEPPAS